MYLPDFNDISHETIINELAFAAARGWTPDDLRHTLGPVVIPFLRESRPHLFAVTHTRIAAAWDRQLRTLVSDTTAEPDHGTLRALAVELVSLPAFTDADTYVEQHVLLRHNRAATGDSPEQVRARQRITGLLRKARSTIFPAEAESLVAKAQQLRQRHRIEHALDDVPEDPEDVVSVRIHLHAPWVRFQFLLLGSVAFPNSCRTVLSDSIGIATLVGHPDDVRHCLELFASLNHQRDYFMRHSPGATHASHHGQTSAYRRSFLFAYANRILDLLDTATTDVPTEQGTSGNALPVLARRDRAAEEMRDRIFPHTSGIRFGHSHHHPGASDGIAAAERSHLGPARTSLNSA
ncbi:DUF2786 domain-containing protein [Corynebacterium sp.]|uniref:DUF2786 domain-containing protein n=1 Tax=Corynebacterium sp. TaxID=1720 RepID=UPI0019B1BCBF|nr:DUF2786 domain-containing protein [Corynebacterium sp.]HHU66549.1 DUF2786 domain-containing protein [Corynebacterium sp.]